jgi:hypothetical protein
MKDISKMSPDSRVAAQTQAKKSIKDFVRKSTGAQPVSENTQITNAVMAEVGNGMVFYPTSESRSRALKYAMQWIADRMKKDDPQAVQHLEHFREKVWALANRAEIGWSMSHGHYLAVSEADRDTLVMLTRGTTWFDGNPQMENALIAELAQL